MKTLIFIHTGMILVMLLGIGCNKDELDIPPPNKVTLEQAHSTTAGIDQTITAAYRNMADGNALSGRYYWWAEAMADHVKPNTNITGDFLNIYNRDFVASPGGGDLSYTYRAINLCNEVLRSVELNRPTDAQYASNKDRMKGEALFLRAICNFEMVRYYGPQFGKSANNDDLGVVLLKEPVEGRIQPARNTVAETYNSIMEDLLAAEQLLPATFDPVLHLAEYRGRAVKDAARAYLVRVYFQQSTTAGNIKALEYINKLIGASPGTIINYPLGTVLDAFNKSGETAFATESIFQIIGVPGQSLADNLRDRYKLISATPASNSYIASAKFLADTRFYNADKRKTDLLITVSGSTYTKKYDLQNMNIPKIRSAEMILDRAEINVAGNNLPDAVKDINVIRQRANIPLIDAAAINAVQLLDTIRIERIREFCFEGDRLHYLKRSKADIPAGDRTNATPIPWNANKILMKYSQGELDRNSNLVQNND
ncbi:MAG: RagB/SusD family nutrient uptake outer membrane protein [Rhizobacter sp.]|nr:RagB/SusD family nutrient uptake outer membrane protein [Ferruginibacter sp.]